MTAGGSYLLERVSSGGLLLDLDSGSLFTLNEVAVFIWERRLQGQLASQIAGELARSRGIAVAAAERDVAATLAPRASGRTTPLDPNGYTYLRAGNGYLFSKQDIPVLFIDEEARQVTRADPRFDQAQLLDALWSISPKLLALAGGVALHASGVLSDGAVTGFSGESGAGKTTTARSVARAGARLFCEDKLLLRLEGGRVEAMAGLEDHIRQWARRTAEALTAGQPSDASVVADRPGAEWFPVRGIGLIAADRRAGADIRARRLRDEEAAGELFYNCFHGSDRPDRWQQQLTVAAELSRRIEVLELTMPLGASALDAAAAGYLRALHPGAR